MSEGGAGKPSSNKPLLNYCPIYYLPKCLKMCSALVLVVEVVGVLPDVEGEEGFEAVGDGVVGVGVLGDAQLPCLVGLEPDPAGAEEANTLRLEVGLEGVEGAPLLDNLLAKRRSRVKPGMRGTRCPVGAGHDELQKVQVVVQNLAGIVEHSRIAGRGRQ